MSTSEFSTRRTIFSILLNQTKFRLYLQYFCGFGTKRNFIQFKNQSEKGKYILIFVWLNKNQKMFLIHRWFLFLGNVKCHDGRRWHFGKVALLYSLEYDYAHNFLQTEYYLIQNRREIFSFFKKNANNINVIKCHRWHFGKVALPLIYWK